MSSKVWGIAERFGVLTRIAYVRSDKTIPIQRLEVLAKQAEYRASSLAGELQMSLRTLERWFREQVGTSPQRWLRALREQEVWRLIHSGLRGKEIGFEVGYRHASSFCRSFKRDTGTTLRRFKNSKTRTMEEIRYGRGQLE